MQLQPSPRLRPAVAADAPRVAALLIAARAAFMPYAPSPHSEDDIRTWVSRTLFTNSRVIVAEIDAMIVGVAATEVDQEASWITQMAVDPARVGQGIGAALLAHVLNALPRPIRLYTFQQNERARRFYERHHFAPIKFSDGRDNEEKCPDVLYELK